MGIAQSTAQRVNADDQFRSQVLQLMRDADFGITGISVEESPMASLPEDAPNLVRDVFASIRKLVKDKEIVKFSVSTEHVLYPSRESVWFDLEDDESNGTQRFFALAGPVLDALNNGHLLVIDELECSMHPLLTRKLIELFQSQQVNRSGAQLIFATHDSSVMDASLFRRDQIWLTEKRRNGSTEIYSLYDFDSKSRPRKSEALEKNYLAGRYGAVPNFGPTFEDLEVQ